MSLLDSIICWAASNEAIQAALLTGSKASLKGGDAFSDDDIALFGKEFPFLINDAWLQQIGPFALCIHDRFQAKGFDIPTRLVIFDRFVKVDFSFHPYAELEQMCATNKLPDAYNIGYKTLLDKTGICKQLPPPAYTGFNVGRPSPEAFQNNTNEFFFEAWHVLKYLQRGELWAAWSRLWSCMQWLLKLLEWQESLKHGWEFSPKPGGKNVTEWLQQALRRPVASCFPEMQLGAMKMALLRAISLYREIVRELAQDLAYDYHEPSALVEWMLRLASD